MPSTPARVRDHLRPPTAVPSPTGPSGSASRPSQHQRSLDRSRRDSSVVSPSVGPPQAASVAPTATTTNDHRLWSTLLVIIPPLGLVFPPGGMRTARRISRLKAHRAPGGKRGPRIPSRATIRIFVWRTEMMSTSGSSYQMRYRLEIPRPYESPRVLGDPLRVP